MRDTTVPSQDRPWLQYYSQEAINAPLPEHTIYGYLWENNREHLQDTALIYFGRKITYGMLFDEIDRTARAFTGIGMKKGDVCTVVSLSCVNSIVVFYALNKIGAISNYINVIASESEFQSYFAEAKSRFVVTLDLFAKKALQAGIKSGAERIITFSLADYMGPVTALGYKLKYAKASVNCPEDRRILPWKKLQALAARKVEAEWNHDSQRISIWAHTGGTTGFPKTVLLTDQAYNAVAMQYKMSMAHQRGEVFLNIIVPFVVYGMLTCLHMPLCLGLTVAVIPKFEAADWSLYLRKYRPNHIAGIPSYFSPMLQDRRLESADLSKILTLAAGGDGLNERMEKELNIFLQQHGSKAQLIKGYGMTEICSSAVTTFGDYTKLGSVGIPLVKNNIRVYDRENGRECRYGETGEILLSSPSLMVCYKDNEKETDDLLITDSDGTKWVRTGDLGYVDPQGFLFLQGRIKRVMFIGPEGMAYKVFPGKIEDVIMSVPHVFEVCVVSAHNGSGFAPKAYVVLKKDIPVSKAETRAAIQRTCEELLPDYLRPFAYEFLEELPKTAVGKIDYRRLEDSYREN